MAKYSPEFKRDLVQKILSQKGTRIDKIAAEHGISRATSFRWLQEFFREANGEERRSTRPQEWSLASKMKALIETRNMREGELGIYLRKNGLYHCHLEQWKVEVLDQVSRKRKLNQLHGNDKESIMLQQIRDLQRQLKLKDKALKEATALLALKKKAESIWGARREEKSQPTTEDAASNSSKKPKPTDVE